VDFVIVYGDEYYAVVAEKLTGKEKARIHH
jgi:hypothetical protein